MRQFSWMATELRLSLRNLADSIRRPLPPREWSRGSAGDVILVPGFSGGWSGFERIATALGTRGYRVHYLPQLDFSFQPIAWKVDQLARFVVANDLKDLRIIGHSLGGIVTRQLVLKKELSGRIVAIVTICTPIKGTYLGLVPFGNAHELLPNSTLIASQVRCDAKLTNINLISSWDYTAIPARNRFADDAKNTVITTSGHIAPLESDEVLAKILTLCR